MRHYLLLLSFLFFALTVYSETFTVTTNADSGPGSLREAIQRVANNGTNNADFIYFNLPGTTEQDRTIRLLTELPNLSSNLTIDASSQPGSKFGVSNSKVKIEFDIQTDEDEKFSGLNLFGVESIEIYGIYLKGIGLTRPMTEFIAIRIANSNNVTIGSPGKGNVLTGFGHPIAAGSNSNLKIASNFFGLEPDGITTHRFAFNNTFSNCIETLFGGTSPEEGNTSAVGMSLGNNITTNINFRPFRVLNNFFGTDYTGTVSLSSTLVLDIYELKQDLYIQNNVIASIARGLMVFNNCLGKIFIQGNYLNVNRNLDKIGDVWASLLSFNLCTGQVLIGGENEGEGNVFTNAYMFAGIFYSPSIILSRNRIFCITIFSRIYPYFGMPYVSITSHTSSEIRGTADPGAKIELFLAQCTCGEPSPDIYFGSVIANADGDWVYNGSVAGKIFVISTVNGHSGDFYTIYLNEFSVNVRDATCSRKGSISGITSPVAGNVRWINQKGEVVGTTLNINNLDPGKYRLMVGDGICPLSSQEYEIQQENNIRFDEQVVKLIPASCNQAEGSIRGISVSGANKYEWLNEGGEVFAITRTPDLENAPPGKYILKASNLYCSSLSQQYEIIEVSQKPFPDYPATLIHPCGNTKGGIVMNFGTVNRPKAIEWIGEEGDIVGTEQILDNVDAGTYKLYLTDDSGCKSLFKVYALDGIPELKIIETSVRIANDQCNAARGAIADIRVTGGQAPFSYKWINDSGTEFGTSATLNNVPAGTYYLSVSDKRCSALSSPFIILNDNVSIAAPIINDVQICAPGSATIAVSRVEAGVYKLYKSLLDHLAISENETGVFPVTVANSDTYYVSFSNGTCESIKVPVKVEVTVADVKLPNSFTPNGDGINDVWSIKGILNYPDAKVSIYDRYGGLVFESRGYSQPFDGKKGDKELPIATYYYLIELRRGCNLISGSLTIVR